ncbi:MAG: alpha-galactosidase, partial [Pseudomonadales bacterium]|nr:alpha-galactosidase [Pseudomonadales bacterium]
AGDLPLWERPRTTRSLSPEYRGVSACHLNYIPQEYPGHGVSDFRQPAIHPRHSDGSTVCDLVFQDYQISADKPGLPGLPAARGGNSQTLLIRLADQRTGLVVELSYTIYAEHDVLSRSARISNQGTAMLNLQSAFSSALDLPAGDYELLHLAGSWSREFETQRMPLPAGRFIVESARGASSAVHSPFVVVMEQGSNEEQGCVYATALLYSGNFAISIEQGEFGDIRVLAGINPFNFNWQLAPGASFQTPESLQVFSRQGLDGMSQIWHRFIAEKISPQQFAHQARPAYFNSWEAAYFSVDEAKMLALASQVRSLGLDLLVMDDGWFEGRNSDRTSLGDWTADRQRFPGGLETLAAGVHRQGLRFGLWVEPEMINRQSRLYATHPDWLIGVAGQPSSPARNQFVLDLSRDEVVEHLYSVMDTLLGSGSISYIKWDMNRYMTEVGSSALSAEQQGEVAHRYLLGLYRLLDRLTQKYPTVLFENCASGGGRFDLGMLHYMAQGWLSDMCDPVGRLEIVNGASYLFPPSTMAAYIGPSPNHQNGRISSLQSRGHVTFFCAARGVSLSATEMEAEQAGLQDLVSCYRESADMVVNAGFHRLLKTGNEVCWQLTAADGSEVYLGYFYLLASPNAQFRRVRLRGLDPQSFYCRAGRKEKLSGAALMHAGLAMPVMSLNQSIAGVDYMPAGDFSSVLLKLQRVQ